MSERPFPTGQGAGGKDAGGGKTQEKEPGGEALDTGGSGWDYEMQWADGYSLSVKGSTAVLQSSDGTQALWDWYSGGWQGVGGDLPKDWGGGHGVYADDLGRTQPTTSFKGTGGITDQVLL